MIRGLRTVVTVPLAVGLTVATAGAGRDVVPRLVDLVAVTVVAVTVVVVALEGLSATAHRALAHR